MYPINRIFREDSWPERAAATHGLLGEVPSQDRALLLCGRFIRRIPALVVTVLLLAGEWWMRLTAATGVEIPQAVTVTVLGLAGLSLIAFWDELWHALQGWPITRHIGGVTRVLQGTFLDPLRLLRKLPILFSIYLTVLGDGFIRGKDATVDFPVIGVEIQFDHLAVVVAVAVLLWEEITLSLRRVSAAVAPAVAKVVPRPLPRGVLTVTKALPWLLLMGGAYAFALRGRGDLSLGSVVGLLVLAFAISFVSTIVLKGFGGYLLPFFRLRNWLLPRIVRMLLVVMLPVVLAFGVVHGDFAAFPTLFTGVPADATRNISDADFSTAIIIAAIATVLLIQEPEGGG